MPFTKSAFRLPKTGETTIQNIAGNDFGLLRVEATVPDGSVAPQWSVNNELWQIPVRDETTGVISMVWFNRTTGLPITNPVPSGDGWYLAVEDCAFVGEHTLVLGANASTDMLEIWRSHIGNALASFPTNIDAVEIQVVGASETSGNTTVFSPKCGEVMFTVDGAAPARNTIDGLNQITLGEGAHADDHILASEFATTSIMRILNTTGAGSTATPLPTAMPVVLNVKWYNTGLN